MQRVRKVLITVVAAIAAVCLVLVAVLLSVSGGFMKQRYLEPWSKTYAEQFDDVRVRVAAVGMLAASGHNMQPWTIKLDPDDAGTFYLYADSSRMTRQVDPYARQMMVSQGTFLEYADIAAEHEGYVAMISLFPNGDFDESNLAQSMDDKAVARVTLAKSGAQSSTAADDAALYDGMFLPNTIRTAYEPTPLTNEQVTAIEALDPFSDAVKEPVGEEPQDSSGVAITLYQDSADVERIGTFAIDSATVEAGVERVMDEADAVFRSNEYQKNEYRYGYSVEGQGMSGFKMHMVQGLVTIIPALNTGSASSRNFISSTTTSVDNTPAYVTLVTKGNSRVEQVEAGILYSRLVLTGHTLGLAMQPLSQVLEEYPEMSTLYDDFKAAYAPDGGTVQMLVRLGVSQTDAPQSMRRDVLSLITS